MKRPRRQQSSPPTDLATLLAAWVDDVERLAHDDEARLPVVPVGDLARKLHRRRAPRAASAILAASAALLSASGVAAAVTGDPLAVYGSAIDSLLGGPERGPAGGSQVEQDETPEPDQREPVSSTAGSYGSTVVPVLAPRTAIPDTSSTSLPEPTPPSSLGTPESLTATDPGMVTSPSSSPSGSPSPTGDGDDGDAEPTASATPSDGSEPSLPAAVVTPQGADESAPTSPLPAESSSTASAPSPSAPPTAGTSPPASAASTQSELSTPAAP